MRRRPFTWLAAALVVVVSTVGCGLAPPTGPAPLRYRDPMFSVTKTANVTFASPVSRQTGLPVALLADIYRPTGDTVTSRPTIIWVHGGSFRSGTRTSPEIVDEANVFASKGYVNISIEYRLSPTGCAASSIDAECVAAILDALTDAQTAVRWLRANAVTYGVDPDRIAIGGSSAGAITALNAAYWGDTPTTGPLPEFSSRVGAAVSISGAAVLGRMNTGDAPTLLFHGTNDVVVPYALGKKAYDDAIAAGLVSYLISWQGAGHVPYAANRTQILDLTTNFLYSSLALANAAQ